MVSQGLKTIAAAAWNYAPGYTTDRGVLFVPDRARGIAIVLKRIGGQLENANLDHESVCRGGPVIAAKTYTPILRSSNICAVSFNPAFQVCSAIVVIRWWAGIEA
jgi:hypothetical protein